MIQIIPLDTRVYIEDSRIQGTVTAISIINNQAPYYEITWWIEGRRTVEWFYESSLAIQPGLTKKVGFKPNKNGAP